MFYWTVTFNLDTYLPQSRKWPEYPGFFEMFMSFSPILLLHLLKDKKIAVSLIFFQFSI